LIVNARFEVRLAADRRDDRGDQAGDDGGHDSPERRADHDADRQVHDVAAQQELTEVVDHVPARRVGGAGRARRHGG
jgi:hypothetical protein